MDTAFQVPTVGTAGHTIGSSATTVTNHEKIMMQKLRGCPINRKMPVRMSRASFVKACLKFQELAGIIPRRKSKKIKTRMTSNGFKSNNRHICPECSAGCLIRNNKPFVPPDEKVEFVDLRPKGTAKKNKAPHRQTTQKLSVPEVIQIRQMHQDGCSITAMLKVFTQVGRATISNVVNRVTWKHI